MQKAFGGQADLRDVQMTFGELSADLITDRDEQDLASGITRFPQPFRNAESVLRAWPWPTIASAGHPPNSLVDLEVPLVQLARGHAIGEAVARGRSLEVPFSGTLVPFASTPFAGDAKP